MLRRPRSAQPAPDGEWVQVLLPDGTARQDWIPTDQPAAPGGSPGNWHVVGDPLGAASRWEWHPVAPMTPLATTDPDEVTAHHLQPAPPAVRRPPTLGLALLCFPGAAAVVSGVMLLNQLLHR